MSTEAVTKPDGHEKCYASTGICESLTFGRGYLDRNGYWEVPCYECARAFQAKAPDMGPCWPFEPDAETHCKDCGRELGVHTAICRSDDFEDVADFTGLVHDCGCKSCHAEYDL